MQSAELILMRNVTLTGVSLTGVLMRLTNYVKCDQLAGDLRELYRRCPYSNMNDDTPIKMTCRGKWCVVPCPPPHTLLGVLHSLWCARDFALSV